MRVHVGGRGGGSGACSSGRRGRSRAGTSVEEPREHGCAGCGLPGGLGKDVRNGPASLVLGLGLMLMLLLVLRSVMVLLVRTSPERFVPLDAGGGREGQAVMPMVVDGTTSIRGGATPTTMRAGLGGRGMLEMSRAAPDDAPGSVAAGSRADAGAATGPADAAHAGVTRGQEGLGGGQPAVGQVGYGPTGGGMHPHSPAVGTALKAGTSTAAADADRSATGSTVRPGRRGVGDGADVARSGGLRKACPRPCCCGRVGKRGRGRSAPTGPAGPALAALLPAVRVVPCLHLADGRPVDDGGLHELPELLPRIPLGLPREARGTGTGTGRCLVGNGAGGRGGMGRWWGHSVKGGVGLALTLTRTIGGNAKGGRGSPPGGVPHQMRIAEGRAAEDPPQLGIAAAATGATASATAIGGTPTPTTAAATASANQGRPGPVVRPAPPRRGREVEGRPARQGPAHPRGTAARTRSRQGQAQTQIGDQLPALHR